MKANGLLPWIVVVASLGGVVFLYSQNQKAQAELVTLRQGQEELTRLREQVAELEKVKVAEGELERFRKEAAEVYKLRNEVRQLQNEKNELAARSQTLAQSPSDGGSLQQALQELQQLRSENEALRNASVKEGGPTVEQNLAAYKNECINNLRMIDGATQQWALENSKLPGDMPEYVALLQYLQNPPVCPQGGSYTFAGVGKKPTCNMPEHKLPE